MNYQSTTLAKTLYKDTTLNADLMKKVLFLTLHGNCMEEMSVKQLSIYEKVGDKYQSDFNKRYDFVDLLNKRVYEFDGDQHFNYNEFFDNSDYSNFVKRRSADITKQNILVELGYDLVRIKGELTVDEFVDLLVALNLKKGQSVFIENSTYYQVIDTTYLSSELDQIELLQRLNAQLAQENAELKAMLTQSKDNDQSKEMLLEGDTVSQFLEDYIDKLKFYHTVPVKVLFSAYNEWRKFNNPNGGYFKYQTFAKSVSDYCKMKGIKYDSRNSTYTKYHYRVSLSTLLNIDIDSSSFSQRQSAIIFDNAITLEEIDQFERVINSSTKLEDLTDRQIQTILMMSYDLNKTSVRSIFGELF